MNKMHFIEGFEAPVIAKPDLCVVGGGPAGLSAAVGAARCGKNVLLIEKNGFCGGETVAGLSGTICGLYSSGEKPEQIVFGFADEFYSLLEARQGVTSPVKFGKTMLVPHDGLIWKEIADDLLLEHKIQVLYHSVFVKAWLNETGKICKILIYGANSFSIIEPQMIIDASGDAVVVNEINGSSYLGNNGMVQTPTMIFKMGNVNMDLFFKIGPQKIDDEIIKAHHSGKYNLPRHHVYAFPLPNKKEVLCNMTRITFPDGSIPMGISSQDLTYAEIEGRKQAREYANFLIDAIPAFKNSYMVDTGCKIGIRQTRSIEGKQKLMNHDVIEARKYKGAVSHSAWPIEAHGVGELKIVYLENDYYDIPFETLIPDKGRNLLVAGRCMSAEHEALASARVTGQCFGMGYAVGAASSLMLDENTDTQNIEGIDVNFYMKKHHLKNSYQK